MTTDWTRGYAQLADDLDLPRMKMGTFACESTALGPEDDPWAHLRAQNPTAGWLLFQSHQCVFRNGLPEAHAAWGILLAGEAVLANGEAVHLEQDGRGGWLATHYRHCSEGTEPVDRITLLARDGTHLHYRRYWALDPEQGAGAPRGSEPFSGQGAWVPVTAVLAGIESTGEAGGA